MGVPCQNWIDSLLKGASRGRRLDRWEGRHQLCPMLPLPTSILREGNTVDQPTAASPEQALEDPRRCQRANTLIPLACYK